MRRAATLHPELSPAQVEAALAQLDLWSETVPDSASDAYQWEVERPVDKRVIRADFLASEARAQQALERRVSASTQAPASSGLAAAPTFGPAAATIVSPTMAAAPAPGEHPAAGGPSAFVVGATPIGARYKLFVGGAQRGPYALEELAQQLARGEIDMGTRIWNMQWNPRQDKWKTVGEIPELAGTGHAAIPDPDDGVPDPD
jgi:hypothetical protein